MYGKRDAFKGTQGLRFLWFPNRNQIREDPRATAPPDVIDAELHKGLHHLLVKGVIPPNQDLSDALVRSVSAMPVHKCQRGTVPEKHCIWCNVCLNGGTLPVQVGEHGPMQTRPADIMEFPSKFKKAPVTTALEDHALSSQNRFQVRVARVAPSCSCIVNLAAGSAPADSSARGFCDGTQRNSLSCTFRLQMDLLTPVNPLPTWEEADKDEAEEEQDPEEQVSRSFPASVQPVWELQPDINL